MWRSYFIPLPRWFQYAIYGLLIITTFSRIFFNHIPYHLNTSSLTPVGEAIPRFMAVTPEGCSTRTETTRTLGKEFARTFEFAKTKGNRHWRLILVTLGFFSQRLGNAIISHYITSRYDKSSKRTRNQRWPRYFGWIFAVSRSTNLVPPRCFSYPLYDDLSSTITVHDFTKSTSVIVCDICPSWCAKGKKWNLIHGF